MPLYPLYALFFADSGVSEAGISALFAIWSLTGILVEVPAGALADRYSRRNALVAAGLLQAFGYLVWTALPTFAGFAAGFILWGLGGALVSGALEALLYDGLVAVGAESHFATLLGRVTAAGLSAQLPAAAAATLLYAVGGYVLVGWASVGCCVGAAGLAMVLPEPPRRPADGDDSDGGGGGAADGDGDGDGTYLGTLRAGLRDAAARPGVRGAVLAVAVLTGVDALEEYFPLLGKDWGVPTTWIPAALLVIPAGGALGAILGGAAAGSGRQRPAALLLASALLLGGAGLLARPLGLFGVAAFYGLYRCVLVAVNARLQERIRGSARATVTSVAALGSELTALGLYAAWAAGGVVLIAALLAVAALGLPRLLRVPGRLAGDG